jgi:hypothetical protein
MTVARLWATGRVCPIPCADHSLWGHRRSEINYRHLASSRDVLLRVQNDLFAVLNASTGKESPRASEGQLTWVEETIDLFNAGLGRLDSFVSAAIFSGSQGCIAEPGGSFKSEDSRLRNTAARYGSLRGCNQTNTVAIIISTRLDTAEG